MKKTCLLLAAIAALIPSDIHAQSLHDKSAQRQADSAAVRSVSGGATLDFASPYEAVFDALVNTLKRNGFTLDQADKDAGQLATAMEISGGFHQTGKRTIFSLIKGTDGKTSVRVAVTIQKRSNGLQADPWSDPKVDEKASADYAAKIKLELDVALAAKPATEK